MKLSTKSRYALRILMQIALDSGMGGGSPSKGSAVAKAQGISEPYLEQIMIPLKKVGMVKAVRGCNGGYFLKRHPADISLLDIIETFEGRLKLVNCGECPSACVDEHSCPAAKVWDDFSGAVRREAAKITLADVLDIHHSGGAPGQRRAAN